MTNQVIATNIKIVRESKGWSQEQLADIAGINARTVQRAERAHGTSADTLQAMARAFAMTVDQLTFDRVGALAAEVGVERDALTPELLAEHERRKKAEIEAKYRLVPVERIGSADDISFGRGHAMHFGVVSGSDEARDVAADLESLMRDLLDLYSDLDPVERREEYKRAVGYVRRLEALGCVVSIGLDETRLRMKGAKDSMDWQILYVVVWNAADAKDFVGVERGAKVQFQ